MSQHSGLSWGLIRKSRSSWHPEVRLGKAACRVALFLMNGGEYQQLIRSEGTEAAARRGVALEVFSADGDGVRQAEQIESCLGRAAEDRPSALLVYPVRESALLASAHRATRLGVGFVLLGRWSAYLDDLRAEFPRLPIFSVVANQTEIGHIQGRQIRALLPHGGELVCIRGALGVSSTTRRFEGLRQALENTSIPIFAINCDWTQDGGARAMTEWLQIFGARRLPVFGVAAQNDAMAMGAKDALLKWARVRPDFSPARVPIVGCDGTPTFGQRLTKQKEISATVIMPPTAGKAVDEVAAMLLSRAPRPDAEVVLGPSSYPALDALTWSEAS
jgi:ribose transport system substrate-binding protein